MRIQPRITLFAFATLLSILGCGSTDDTSTEAPEQGAEEEVGVDESKDKEKEKEGDAAAVTNSAVKDKPLLTECYKGDTFSCTVEAVIARETNTVRGGRKALALSFEDSFVARQWSLTQAEDGNISHDGFPYDRKKVLAADFPNAKWGFGAENVGIIRGSETDAEAVGKQLVGMWKGSEGHLRNMLGNYAFIGVGVTRKGNNVYATQIFH
ncbi:MAG: CAP domain-containing protein [Proteobacteria bacterium]|nr:MAG: CAP domain-containing protein [Pseudomonadota bacterium]